MARSRSIFIPVCVYLLAAGACRNESLTPTEGAKQDFSVDTVKTVINLKKVND